MTKKRMIYMGVMALAVGVLVWDKCLRTDSHTAPQTSAAEILRPESSPTQPNPHGLPGSMRSSEPVGPMAISGNAGIPTLPVMSDKSGQGGLWAKIFSKISNSSPVADRDLFSPTPRFCTALWGDPDEIIEPVENVPSFHLSAILTQTEQNYALINDEIVCCGQTLDSYRVVTITAEQVVLESLHHRVVLSPEKPPVLSSINQPEANNSNGLSGPQQNDKKIN